MKDPLSEVRRRTSDKITYTNVSIIRRKYNVCAIWRNK